jgi:hypothetical protein
MTKADILAKVERHELSTTEALVLIEKLERMERAKLPPAPPPPVRQPPRFKVADNSGWCSVYFDGLRRPCTLPSALWLELMEPDNLERFRKFLEENKERFRNKVAVPSNNGHAV